MTASNSNATSHKPVLDMIAIMKNTMPRTTPACATRVVSAPYDEEMACCTSPALISPCASEDLSNASMLDTDEPSPNIEEKYIVDPRVLGSGHHGSVRQCMDRKTGQRLAVKSIRKSDPAVNPGYINREIRLLNEMKHSNIIQLVDVFEDDESLHLVTDLCKGGELFDKILEKASSGNGCFSEYEAARILHQILTAVSYMHKRNIVHRDLKPENILFETTAEDSPVKIIDFGLARKHYANMGEPNMTTVVGTPYYIAPEVLGRSYGKACDLWSIGVIAYLLLCGYPPFNGADNKEVYESILRGFYRFPVDDWKEVSSGAKDFIRRLLQRDPRNRMTVDQALRHPWLVRQLKYGNRIAMSDVKDNTSVEVIFGDSLKKEVIVCGGVVNHQISSMSQ